MAAEATDTPKITSALGPDLKAVRQFITEMVTRGAIVLLIEAIVGLLARMRDLNTDLLGKLAQRRRAHPPSETLRRLQMELPFLRPSSDADPASGGDPAKKKRKKLGAKNPRPHGRGKLPAHLPRVVQEHRVPDAERVCTRCNGPMKTVCFKCSERLELVPAHFVVLDVRREVVACGRAECHAQMRTAPRPDEIIDRGKLGPELAVQALVDHYADGVPWERMARNARAQSVPLSANTLAAAAWGAVDLLDPIVRHITHKRCSRAADTVGRV